MKVLHLLASGGIGGIEVLCKNIAYNSETDNRWVTLFADGEIYEDLKRNNMKIFSVSTLKLKDKINEISKYCKNEKIDIIIVHHGSFKCNIIYYLLKKKNKNLKCIRYMHACFDKYAFGNSKNIIKNCLIKIVMQKAINISDKIIYISQAVKMSFEKRFTINKSVGEIIYNGIDESFEINKKNNVKDKNITNLIFVGRIEKVKGVDILIKAVSKLKNDKIVLTIVGDGSEKQKLEKIVKKMNLEDKIKFVGRQNNVIEWLDKADVFVYPSIWEEGFGISVVEAMSRGCIPIVSNRGALPEIVKDEVNGLIFEHNKFKNTLVEKIESIINKSDIEIEKMKQNAIEDSKMFELRNTINKLDKIYFKLI